MFDDVKERYDLIEKILNDNGESVDLVRKAFNYANDLHKNQRRKDGLLYITHPVEVALILANLGFDEDVISAALLHDVVEDCGCTIEGLTKDFNVHIAEMVDCVSAIDQAKYELNESDVFEDKNFEKASMEEQSFKKLIAIGRKNPLGFCIKFADRLHNLRTISCFDYSKQLEKVKETEKWIIPIAKTLNSEYFYRAIKNECFKIKHKFDGVDFFEHYDGYYKSNSKNVENLLSELNKIFDNGTIKTIKIKSIREYKVFEQLEKMFKNINIQKVSQGQILKVANYNLYMLFDGKSYDDIVENILKVIDKKLSEIKIIDAKIGTFTNKPYFQLEDKFKNKFNLYIESYADYIKQRNGTMDGHISDLIDDDNIDNLDVELIKVKTRSGEIKFVPQNSTVLDFAFKIHKDIGFGFKYAIVNNSKTKSPPYTKLFEGDQVEIIVDKNSLGEIKNNAELKWFAYVNSDFAKKVLIKYFEKR